MSTAAPESGDVSWNSEDQQQAAGSGAAGGSNANNGTPSPQSLGIMLPPGGPAATAAMELGHYIPFAAAGAPVLTYSLLPPPAHARGGMPVSYSMIRSGGGTGAAGAGPATSHHVGPLSVNTDRSPYGAFCASGLGSGSGPNSGSGSGTSNSPAPAGALGKAQSSTLNSSGGWGGLNEIAENSLPNGPHKTSDASPSAASAPADNDQLDHNANVVKVLHCTCFYRN